MDKEAHEDIARVLAGHGAVMDSHRNVAKDVWAYLRYLGYRKLPKDKPPIVSDEELRFNG